MNTCIDTLPAADAQIVIDRNVVAGTVVAHLDGTRLDTAMAIHTFISDDIDHCLLIGCCHGRPLFSIRKYIVQSVRYVLPGRNIFLCCNTEILSDMRAALIEEVTPVILRPQNIQIIE